MAELADALDLGSSSFGSAGSTPVRATLGPFLTVLKLQSEGHKREAGK